MSRWFNYIHKTFVYIGGNWGVPIGLLYFVLQNAKLGILPKIFSETVSNWVYNMLTTIGLWIPYIVGIIAIFWLALSIRKAIQDIKKWKAKKNRIEARKIMASSKTTKNE